MRSTIALGPALLMEEPMRRRFPSKTLVVLVRVLNRSRNGAGTYTGNLVVLSPVTLGLYCVSFFSHWAKQFWLRTVNLSCMSPSTAVVEPNWTTSSTLFRTGRTFLDPSAEKQIRSDRRSQITWSPEQIAKGPFRIVCAPLRSTARALSPSRTSMWLFVREIPWK